MWRSSRLGPPNNPGGETRVSAQVTDWVDRPKPAATKTDTTDRDEWPRFVADRLGFTRCSLTPPPQKGKQVERNVLGLNRQMQYARPNSLKEAIRLVTESKENAFVMAGGSDLLVRMKGGDIEPNLIVDIKAITGLGEIKQTNDGFVIGAAVPCALMGETKALREVWPGVVEAANLIGSRQIQGRCTIAGNLCNASPAADSVPALVAAAANVVVRWSGGGPARLPLRTWRLAPATHPWPVARSSRAIMLDKRPPHSGDAYLRFIPRTEMDIAVVGAGVSLTLDGQGRVEIPRVALGAVAPTVLWCRRLPRQSSARSSTRPLSMRSPPRVRQPAVRSTTSVVPSNSGGRLRACLPGARQELPTSGREQSDVEHSSFNHHQW